MVADFVSNGNVILFCDFHYIWELPIRFEDAWLCLTFVM